MCELKKKGTVFFSFLRWATDRWCSAASKIGNLDSTQQGIEKYLRGINLQGFFEQVSSADLKWCKKNGFA